MRKSKSQIYHLITSYEKNNNMFSRLDIVNVVNIVNTSAKEEEHVLNSIYKIKAKYIELRRIVNQDKILQTTKPLKKLMKTFNAGLNHRINTVNLIQELIEGGRFKGMDFNMCNKEFKKANDCDLKMTKILEGGLN